MLTVMWASEQPLPSPSLKSRAPPRLPTVCSVLYKWRDFRRSRIQGLEPIPRVMHLFLIPPTTFSFPEVLKLTAKLSLIPPPPSPAYWNRSEEHTSELQSQFHLVCRLLLEKT